MFLFFLFFQRQIILKWFLFILLLQKFVTKFNAQPACLFDSFLVSLTPNNYV